MNHNFDYKLNELKTKITQFKMCQDICEKGVLLHSCYLGLNQLLQEAKIKSIPLSQQSQILQQKTILQMADDHFIQEINFDCMIKDAIELQQAYSEYQQVYNSKRKDRTKIDLLSAKITDTLKRIIIGNLTTKQQKQYHDVLKLLDSTRTDEEKVFYSFEDQDICPPGEDDKLNELVLKSQELSKISDKLSDDIKREDYDEIFQTITKCESLNSQPIQEKTIIQNKNILNKTFQSMLKLCAPIVVGIVGLAFFVSKPN